MIDLETQASEMLAQKPGTLFDVIGKLANLHRISVTNRKLLTAAYNARPSRRAMRRIGIKNRKGKRPSGIVVWKGESLWDGAPIVVVATGLDKPSANIKTGDYLQFWIIRTDVEPKIAIRTGSDESVCGDCIHRQSPRSCYVNTQTIMTVHSAYARGMYPDLSDDLATVLEIVAGSLHRYGAYGDPGMVPVDLWIQLASVSAGHAGYTQRWRDTMQDGQSVLMASCTYSHGVMDAISRGWRVFRTALPDQDIFPGEKMCPSAKSNGKISCVECRGCSGSDRRGKGFAIPAHGAGASAYRKKYLAGL
jgi:hypothetical protein